MVGVVVVVDFVVVVGLVVVVEGSAVTLNSSSVRSTHAPFSALYHGVSAAGHLPLLSIAFRLRDQA